MKSDYTHITVIIDRSGSMEAIKDDTIGGFNSFLGEQKNQEGKATLTLVQFDSQDPYEVCCHFRPIAEVPELDSATYVPRASTPLLDCLGRGIADLGNSLDLLKPDEKPSRVIFAVVTDGQENCSREFRRDQIVKMIADRTQRDGWQFVFLSADLVAIGDAMTYGIQAGAALPFIKTGQGTRAAWNSLSRESSDYRKGRKRKIRFVPEDRTHPDDPMRKANPGMCSDKQSAPRSGNRAVFEQLIGARAIDIKRGPIFDWVPSSIANDMDFDKVEGMMLGLAIGDSMGRGTEARNPVERRLQFGERREYLPQREAGLRRVGLPSDDTQLAFWTLEHLLQENGLVPEGLAQLFTSGRRIYGIGKNIRRFIQNFKDLGKPWYQAGPKSAGNGALMRIAPMLVPYLKRPSSDLWIDTALSAMVTHNDSGSTAACIAFMNMLWKLLAMKQAPDPMWWPDEYVKVASTLECDEGYRPRGGQFTDYKGPIWRFVREHVVDSYRKGMSTLDACESWYSGAFLLETVPSVIYILMKHGQDLEEAMVRSVNDTRDNDTVAAIVGAAVGALHGKHALPRAWRDNLLGRTMKDDDGRVFQLLKQARGRWWDD